MPSERQGVTPPLPPCLGQIWLRGSGEGVGEGQAQVLGIVPWMGITKARWMSKLFWKGLKSS